MARKEQITREMFHSRITEEDNREVRGEQNEMSGVFFMLSWHRNSPRRVIIKS